MPYANLTRDAFSVNDGNDSIVVVTVTGEIPGGRTLDVSAVGSDVTVLRAGHVLVKDDTTGVVSPMPVSGDAYGEKPAGTSYVGVLKNSVLKTNPQAAILTQGQVNAAASPYAVTTEMKEALPRIEFLF